MFYLCIMVVFFLESLETEVIMFPLQYVLSPETESPKVFFSLLVLCWNYKVIKHTSYHL